MIAAILSLALATVAANGAETPAKPAKPKKVCEKIEMSGSNVPKRVCRTVVEPVKPKEEATQAATDKPAAGATN